MRIAIRVIIAVLAGSVALLATIYTASESGEVIELTTTGDGSSATTRLWIVDHDGSAWLRSGSPDSQWYARIIADPHVSVSRGGEQFNAVAIPEPGAVETINALMREKYGFADQVIDTVFGRTDAIPIRLIPDTD